MVYIKNRSPASAIYKSTMTPIQDFHLGDPPNVDHIRIFGSEIYVFNESDSQPGLTSKAWAGYLVGYDARNQYRIYDPARNAVFVRRDVRFNEEVVGPPNLSPLTTTIFMIKIQETQHKFFHCCHARQNNSRRLPQQMKISLSILLHPRPLQILPQYRRHCKMTKVLPLCYTFPQLLTTRQILKLSFPHLLKAFLFLKLHLLYLLSSIAIKFPARLRTPTTIQVVRRYLKKTMMVDMVRLVNLSVLEQIRLTTKNIFKKEKPLQPKQTHRSKLLIHIRKLVVSCLTTL